MPARYLMGLDLGGSGGRCLLLDPDSGEQFVSTRAWRHAPVQDQGNLAFNLNFNEIDQALTNTIAEALELAGAQASDIAGIACTGMRHGMVLTDRDLQPIFAVPTRDTRAALSIGELVNSVGPRCLEECGSWPNPVHLATRLRWLATTQDELWREASCVLGIGEYFAARLSGEAAAEPSQASASVLLNLASRDWAWNLIDDLNFPRELFPAVRVAGSPLGHVTDEAASALGLTPGTPVIIGAGDTHAALLAAGVVEPGQIGICAGSTAPLMGVLETPRIDPDGRLWVEPHIIPGRSVVESNAGGVGEALEWFARLLFRDEIYPMDHLFANAAEARLGSRGVLSTLGPQVMDGKSLAFPLGRIHLTPFSLIDTAADRADLARGVVEGIAYGLRANAEQIIAHMGTVPEEIVITGGLARNTFFTQLLSDVLNRPVAVAKGEQTTALGAALSAGVGVGVFENLSQASAVTRAVERRHEPHPDHAAAYESIYQGWSRVRNAAMPGDAEAAGLTIQTSLREAPAVQSSAALRFRPKILVTAELDALSLERLQNLGDVEYASFRDAMRLLTGPDLVEALKGVHIFITEVDVVDAAVLEQATDLRAIAICRSDAVNVDLEACTAVGIPALHAPGRNADAVADLTLTYMLTLARKWVDATQFLQRPGGEAGDMARMGQAFQELLGHELWQKTVGLVGLGAVGRQVAKRLQAFGAKLLVFDPYLPSQAARVLGAEPVDLDELLTRSDFVSLHAPVTPTTEGMIGGPEFGRMKQGAMLINSARAALVDYDALITSLKSGHLGGAAVDVFPIEPPAADDPLLSIPNLIATPHIGGNTVEVGAHQGEIITDDLTRMLRGEAPQHALNPAALERFRWDGSRETLDTDTWDDLKRAAGPTVSGPQRAPAVAAVAAKPETDPASRRDDAQYVNARAKMQPLLGAFVADCLDDDALGTFANGKSVILHFILNDLDLDFQLGFAGDRVIGELGAPNPDPDVQLKMKADIFDGMFTDRVNPMQAAMNGKLSFSGDTAKAMTLQQIQADLSRIYSATRERVGDPGDLGALEPASAAVSVPEGGEGQALKQELVDVVNELYSTQLITATGGNVSARIPETDELWITPSQLFKGDLSPEILVRIDIEGKAVGDQALSASSERMMHCAILKAKPEAQAVVHAHAPHATILANTGLPFLPISTEAAFFSEIPRIPFIMPGTNELAEAIAEAIGDGWAVLMQNHGLLVAGRSLRRAADMVEIIERTCEVILGCYAVGKEPPVLPEETVAILREMGDLVA